jgi:NAD(P)-dependent dehydrogenase (short-subunit alcohol dehydrogenase family)
MNTALISIGTRSDDLEAETIEVAARIGPVDVDHGATGCRTAIASTYIPKARARQRKKEAKPASELVTISVMDIVGTSAIVTGGASGLGAATVRALAAAGASVVILDLQEKAGHDLADALGDGTLFVRTDVTSEEQVATAVDAAEGPLRVAVNCAGIGSASRTIGRDGSPTSLDAFRTVIEVNLVGTFNVIARAASAMARTEPLEHGERGVIVNTASIAAFDGQIGQAAYSASKGGIVGLTLPVARDLSSVGIRVNTIAPGIIDTNLLAGLPEEAIAHLEAGVPFPKRLGRPDEYASLVMEIVRNGYLNGETIRMDGALRMGPR